MIDLVSIGVGVTGTLWGVAFVHRLFFVPPRVRDESAIRVRDRDRESTVDAGVHGGRPASDRGQDGRVRGPGIAVEATATRAAVARGMCFLPAFEHVERFIDWIITDEDGVAHKVVMSDANMFANYLQWAERHGVVPLPAKTMQTLIGKLPHVRKDRPIRKHPKTGRALYHATGSPDRWTRYTISPPRKLPGTVPVADLVQVQPIKTKRQRDAEQAAQAAMPESIAA